MVRNCNKLAIDKQLKHFLIKHTWIKYIIRQMWIKWKGALNTDRLKTVTFKLTNVTLSESSPKPMTGAADREGHTAWWKCMYNNSRWDTCCGPAENQRIRLQCEEEIVCLWPCMVAKMNGLICGGHLGAIQTDVATVLQALSWPCPH